MLFYLRHATLHTHIHWAPLSSALHSYFITIHAKLLVVIFAHVLPHLAGAAPFAPPRPFHRAPCTSVWITRLRTVSWTCVSFLRCFAVAQYTTGVHILICTEALSSNGADEMCLDLGERIFRVEIPREGRREKSDMNMCVGGFFP